jgi:DNA-binding GntR family transcriptional regulator
MEAMGHVPSTVVLVAETVPAPEDTAEALSLAAGSDAIHLKRLRLADGRPVSVDDAWYNPAHAGGLLDIDLTGSVYAPRNRDGRTGAGLRPGVLLRASGHRALALLVPL